MSQAGSKKISSQNYFRLALYSEIAGLKETLTPKAAYNWDQEASISLYQEMENIFLKNHAQMKLRFE